MLSTILKRQVKALKNHTNLKHAQCQALLAKTYRCADFHELQQLIATTPDDMRLGGLTLNPSSFPGSADGWELALEHQATVLARELGISMLEAANLVAQIHGFTDRESIHYQTLDDFISSDEVFYKIDNELEDEMSGSIAETNAYGFTIDDYTVVACDSIDSQLTIVTLDITYTGEQDPDRPWSGNQFHPRVNVYFTKEEGKWVFESLEISADIERDDRNERDYEDLMVSLD